MKLSQEKASPPETSKQKRIFIVEDHPVFRRGLIHLIESEPGFAICGEAASFPTALDELRRVAADVAILDITIDGANGLELVKHLRTEHPHLKLLVVSVHDEMVYGPRALRAGAHGYVMKRESDVMLLEALRCVLEGKVYVSPALSKNLLYRVASQDNGNSPIATLSDRELEVLELVGQGLGSREIAGKLNISVKTVECHRLHLKEKLGIANATELVRFATQWAER